MKVYQLRPDSDRFQWLRMVHAADLRLAGLLRGSPLGETWLSPSVVPLVEEGMPGPPLGDCPTLGSMPTLSARAAAALRPLIHDSVELLPLSCDRGDFFVANVIAVADALDEPRSRIKRFTNGRVMKIDAHEFRMHDLNDLAVFKLPQLLKGQPYVTDRFVEVVRQAGLVGFAFDPVWRGPEPVASAGAA